MSTLEAIKKQERAIARLERELALQKIKERKADARNKIELGGLVIKSQMHRYPKVIILGALLDALEHLQKDEGHHTLYKAKGEAAFMERYEFPSVRERSSREN